MGDTASLQPGTEPAADLRREVTDRVAGPQMHPNLRIFLSGRVRQES
jgi:hypothetical protein